MNIGHETQNVCAVVFGEACTIVSCDVEALSVYYVSKYVCVIYSVNTIQSAFFKVEMKYLEISFNLFGKNSINDFSHCYL